MVAEAEAVKRYIFFFFSAFIYINRLVFYLNCLYNVDIALISYMFDINIFFEVFVT